MPLKSPHPGTTDGNDPLTGATSEIDRVLAGGGEMGAYMRSMDWSQTPLGPPSQWPQSLRTAVSILLNSRYPMFVFWGPQLVKIYNDGYRPITGAKHPWAMGRPGPEVWPEIWDTIGPMVERVVGHGEATWSDDLLLFMERNGFPEEVYFTFSYSPIRDESGGIGGLFCACTETTDKVLGERRLQTLHELAAGPSQARTVKEACLRSSAVLDSNTADIPFSILYLLDEDRTLRLVSTSGVEPARPVSPLTIETGDASGWPFEAAIRTLQPELVTNLSSHFSTLPPGPWPESPHQALVLPLVARGQNRPAGLIVLGIGSRRGFDDKYRDFLALVAGQIATSIANARASEEERRRAEALAELDRAKTAFFSNVSHEFRTPLTLMLGPLEESLAAGETLPSTHRESLAIAHRNAQRLLKLVNTLLDFSRIEAGRIEASYEPTDLAVLTAELSSVFRSAIEQAGLRLVIDCKPLGTLVHVDREMWEKIVFNLLSNAFKFTFEGEIEVAVHQTGQAVTLSVRDTGTGIPSDELPRLFERFHRIKGARGRSFEGSGIGLALVRELVELHGGSVEVQSEPEKGSVFSVTVPVGTAHLPPDRIGASRTLASTGVRGDGYLQEILGWIGVDEAQVIRENFELSDAHLGLEGAQGDQDRPYVLIADDNTDMRDYLRRLLSPHYEVDAVGDGLTAVEKALARKPDLVLTDIMMPELDGLGVLQRMRSHPALRSVPVILLSARAGEEARLEGLAAGADDYLVKPFSARELLARVSARLDLSRLQAQLDQERTILHEQQTELIERLRESDRRKDEFLAMLGHELRNPLAAIRGATELLRLGRPGTAFVERAHEVLDRQVSHVSRLIDGLLEVSRITRGKLTLESQSLDLGELLGRVVHDHQGDISAKGFVVVTDISPGPHWVFGDNVRLVQVFDNLITNAIKFTATGGTITVRLRSEGERVTVSIEDTGIGIEPTLLPYIFEPFRQGNQDTARTSGGLGLGLALVRGIVELHRGTIEARSAGRNAGSQFLIHLPATSAAPVSLGSEETTTVRPRRILIVEDNIDTANMLRDLLQLRGHETATVNKGTEALAFLREHGADVIFCDIGLPDMTGYDVARRIREDMAFDRTTLVALTGYGQPEDRARSHQAGFDEHLVKPITLQTLESVLPPSP